MHLIDINDPKDIKGLTNQQLAELRTRLEVEYSSRSNVTVEDVPIKRITVNTRVRTKTNLTPKYITNREGTVVNVNRTTADVTLDDWSRVNERYIRESYGARFIRVPMKCLEVL